MNINVFSLLCCKQKYRTKRINYDESVFNPGYEDEFENIYGKLSSNANLQETILEIYKLSSEMARLAIDRRIEVNKFFVAAFGGGGAALAVFAKVFEESPTVISLILFAAGAVGIRLASSWKKWIFFLMQQSSYRQDVLEQYEKILPISHWRAVNKRIDDEGIISKAAEKRLASIFYVMSIILIISAAILLFLSSKYADGVFKFYYIDIVLHKPVEKHK